MGDEPQGNYPGHWARTRQDTGKLYKRLLKDQYWGDRDSRIV